MLPHTFFSKEAIQRIEPLIKIRSNPKEAIKIEDTANNSSILTPPVLNAVSKFPLLLNHYIYQPKDIKFYEKYFSSAIYKDLFKKFLTILSQPSHQPQYILASKNIEPILISKLRQNLSSSNSLLELQSIQIKSTKIICQQILHGVFIHRLLNMPSQCYSTQIKSQIETILRMRNKFLKEEHLKLLERKKNAYNANNFMLEKFYMDSYENFAKKQKIKRTFVEINTQIKGKLIFQKKEIPLPLLQVNPITSHIMQVQTVAIPGRSDQEKSIVTDMDFFVAGNPLLQ